jgi:hypothetical protein
MPVHHYAVLLRHLLRSKINGILKMRNPKRTLTLVLFRTSSRRYSPGGLQTSSQNACFQLFPPCVCWNREMILTQVHVINVPELWTPPFYLLNRAAFSRRGLWPGWKGTVGNRRASTEAGTVRDPRLRCPSNASSKVFSYTMTSLWFWSINIRGVVIRVNKVLFKEHCRKMSETACRTQKRAVCVFLLAVVFALRFSGTVSSKYL